MKNRTSIWWGVFLLAAAPSILLFGLYTFNPRALGIDPVEVILQETGEWALRFLLITLACSPLRRLGWKSVVKYRRMLGLFAFYYGTLHLATYIIGWVQLDIVTLLEDVTRRPFIYIGFAVWLMLFVLALTSPKFMVKKLKRNWVLLHKLVYIALLGGLIHLWLQSRASASEALIYIVIALLLLGERFIRKIKRA